MDYFPLFAKLNDKRCLVVGGGAVAYRKVRALRTSGARVTVNTPDLNDELSALAAAGDIEHYPGAFEPGLIHEHLIIIAATSDPQVNRAVADAASQANRLCNVVDDGETSGFIMPSTIDRSPVIVAISTGGQSPVLARMLRQRLDEWLPARIGPLAEWAGQWRQKVKARFQSHDSRLRFWERILDGRIAEQVLADNSAAATQAMMRELSAEPATAERGEAWIVGAGPGDPELITLRGSRLLQTADVVLHDRLVANELLQLARRDADLICVGKQADGPSTPQADINAMLIDLVQRGKRVCRLKGGDPFLFGRGGEEIDALSRAGLPYQVVPGISAANGCAASAGIPLTHRDVSGAVTFVTGYRSAEHRDSDWERLAAYRHTLVIYMGSGQLEHICRQLMHYGRAHHTPAALIENGTTEQQRVLGGTLDDIAILAATAQIHSPALLIVGEVVDKADKLNWVTRVPNRVPKQAAGSDV
jgi:uroporphyrin-III C-methyltransferase/precorrin-2 dehydrogenase/sirohydrochlorin ferrochelatase